MGPCSLRVTVRVVNVSKIKPYGSEPIVEKSIRVGCKRQDHTPCCAYENHFLGSSLPNTILALLPLKVCMLCANREPPHQIDRGYLMHKGADQSSAWTTIGPCQPPVFQSSRHRTMSLLNTNLQGTEGSMSSYYTFLLP